MQHFGDLATFSVDVCILYSESPPYFYFRFVCLTYWTRKYTTRANPHVDNSHQVWSWYDHPLPSYNVFVCWHVTWPGDLDLWPSELEQFSYMADYVSNPATKFEDPNTSRSWVTSYNGSHWLALKMRTRPLRMRRITWPVSRGQKQLHIWNPRPRFAYSLYNFYWATTTIKGRLLSIRPILKPFSAKKFCQKWCPKMAVLGKMGVEALDFGFATPKRHFLERNHVVWRILRRNRCTRLGCSVTQGPPKIAESLCAEGREITHAQNRNP